MDLVHWHEGLFLQPHHLQMLQKSALDDGAAERRLSMPFPYGVVEARLSADCLENMQVRFDRLRAVMPSGLTVDTTVNADVPALNITQAFQRSAEGFVVGLAVPLWSAERGNTVDPGKRGQDDARVKRLWRVPEPRRRLDENTGESPVEVLVRRVNARLVLEGDDTSDMEVLPLLRVSHGTGDDAGTPRRDARFIPPCLVLGGSPELWAMLRDLANQAEASRRDIDFKLRQAGFNFDTARPSQFEDLLRLRILNVHAARLNSIVQALGTGGLGFTPFQLYMEMRTLLAELAALHPNHPDRDLWDAPRYEHDDPAVAFFDLDKKIRDLLRGVVKTSYKKIEFVKDPQGFLAAGLTDEDLKDARELFLGVSSKDDPTSLSRLVEDADKFKLMPKSMWKMTFYGVRLQEDRAPQGLPTKSGLFYFRLNKAETRPQIWEQVVQQKGLAARWPDSEGQGIQDLTLYITYA